MRIRSSAIFNLGGTLVPLIAMLLTVPLYLEAIGDARFGVLAMVWVMLGYFGLFDFGLGKAVANRIARSGSVEERSVVFWSAAAIILTLGSIAGLIFWGGAKFLFPIVLGDSAAALSELESAIPWLAASLPFTLVSTITQGFLAGRERFVALNALRVSEGTLLQFAPLGVALLYSTDLMSLVLTTVVVKLTHTLVAALVCLESISRRPTIELAQVRDLLGFGGWLTVSSVVRPILVTFDRYVISGILGVAAVPAYTIPFGLAFRLTVVPTSLLSALFPRLSAVDGDRQRALVRAAIERLCPIMTLLVFTMVVAARPFITAWLGSDFAARSAFICETLAIGIWFNSVGRIPYNLLVANGRADLPAKLHLAQVVPYGLCLVLSVQFLGLVGAAAIWTIRCWVDSILQYRFAAVRLDRDAKVQLALLVATYVVVCAFNELTIMGVAIRVLAMLIFLLFMASHSKQLVIEGTPRRAKILFSRLAKRFRPIRSNRT